MFNSLGNIAVNPAAGLLFVEFAAGRTLQVSGEACVTWDGGRQVHLRVSRVIEMAGVLPHAYDFLEPSAIQSTRRGVL